MGLPSLFEDIRERWVSSEWRMDRTRGPFYWPVRVWRGMAEHLEEVFTPQRDPDRVDADRQPPSAVTIRQPPKVRKSARKTKKSKRAIEEPMSGKAFPVLSARERKAKRAGLSGDEFVEAKHSRIYAIQKARKARSKKPEPPPPFR